MKIVELFAALIIAVFMTIITLFVCFIPMMVVHLAGLPDYEFLARLMGCVIAIPMVILSLRAIDWITDLKYWRK